MYANTCSDWVMMDSSLMGVGKTWSTMWGPDMAGCGWTGHGTPKDTMWGMPRGMSPKTYHSQMQPNMQRMNSQMAAISKEADPKKREALMREHYATMYREMQSMRGMGWMWAAGAATSLPEASPPEEFTALLGSQPANITVITYCSSTSCINNKETSTCSTIVKPIIITALHKAVEIVCP
jgi:hypothetical protein